MSRHSLPSHLGLAYTGFIACWLALRALLGDNFREAGWGPGHRFGGHPWQRIDCVWHPGDLVAVGAATLRAGVSHHLPVVAQLRYAPA